MEITVFIWAFLSIYLSILMGKFLIKKADKFTLKKTNTDGVRFGSQTKPIYGGVMMYVAFILSVVFSLVISNDDLTVNYLFAFLLTATVGFGVGLTDDLLSTPPLFKFFGQSLVALILVLMGIIVKATDIYAINIGLTFFLVVGVMNSINLLDNMDGISASTSTLILSAVLGMLVFSDTIDFPMVILLAGTVGALIGFLKYNWNPAKMYMGDNGSQFLGAVLSVAGIIFFWNSGAKVEANFQQSFWATLLAFIVPFSDTTTVFINRIARGVSPFIGGRDHTTHHLFYLGLSVKQVGLVLGALSAISLSLSVYIVKFVDVWTMKHNIFLGLYVLIAFALLYSTTKTSKPKDA